MRNRKSAADQIFTGFISEQCFTVPLRDYPNFRKWEKYFFFIGSFGIEVPYLPQAGAVPLHRRQVRDLS